MQPQFPPLNDWSCEHWIIGVQFAPDKRDTDYSWPPFWCNFKFQTRIRFHASIWSRFTTHCFMEPFCILKFSFCLKLLGVLTEEKDEDQAKQAFLVVVCHYNYLWYIFEIEIVGKLLENATTGLFFGENIPFMITVYVFDKEQNLDKFNGSNHKRRGKFGSNHVKLSFVFMF